MYIFYDTEATGLDLDFTQLLQVALVFTDDDLNILSSKKVECRRAPWMVPSPGAMLITGFTPDQLKNSKLSHYEMMREIDGWIRGQHWPVIFSGYNTLGFDEPAFANNLSQNLLRADLTTAESPQNGDKNTRLDIFPMVKVTALYMPGALKLKELNDYGKPGMSLMVVARQNGVVLNPEDAHDAMNDIKATIGVAKVIKKAAPALWDHLCKIATTGGLDEFIAKTPVFVQTDMSYGRNKSIVAAAAGGDANHQVVFDLNCDPQQFLTMSEDELVAVMKRSFYKDATGPAPFAILKKDQQPVVMPLDMADAVLPATFNEQEAQARQQLIAADTSFQQRVATAAAKVMAGRGWAPKQPLAEQTVNNPIDPATKLRLDAWMKKFNSEDSWDARAMMVEDFYQDFADDLKKDPSLRRVVKFAGRIIFDNAPEVLTQEQRDAMMKYIAARMLNPNIKAPYMTINKARAELEKIEAERAAGKPRWQDATDTQIRSLKLYYTALEKEYQPYSPYTKGDNDNDAPDATATFKKKAEPHKPK